MSDVVYYPPRVPNWTIDIKATISAWDTTIDMPGEGMLSQLRISEKGNINVGGSLGGATAPIIPVWHQDFVKFVEPGILPLCLFIVREIGWITYTSCEGHFYDENLLIPSLRHVGILPRSDTEYMQIRSSLESAVRQFNRTFSPTIVAPGLILHELKDDTCSVQVIDLVFGKMQNSNWNEYFSLIDMASVSFLEIFRSLQTLSCNYNVRQLRI